MQQRQVQSLTALEVEHGPYDAVIVAAGAAAGVLPEVGESLVTSSLYMQESACNSGIALQTILIAA